jgi:hypothetical protein
VLECCANWELHPASAGLGVLSGRISLGSEPRLKLRLSPFQRLQPRGRGVQLGLRAILPHSNTPSLRVARFEDEEEYRAPCEGLYHLSLTTDYPQILTSAAAVRRADPVRSLQEAPLWSQEQNKDKTKHQLRTAPRIVEKSRRCRARLAKSRT